jgi:hypothetical protein
VHIAAAVVRALSEVLKTTSDDNVSRRCSSLPRTSSVMSVTEARPSVVETA